MPDDPQPSDNSQDAPSPADEQKGYMVSLAVVLIAILAIMVLFMNLSGQEATASIAIAQNPWSLQSLSAPDGTTTPALNGTTVTATFTQTGKLTGSGGCNQYSARYLVKDTIIVISELSSTKMNCPEEGVMQQESWYFSRMESAAALRIHDRTLTLYDADGKPLVTYAAA